MRKSIYCNKITFSTICTLIVLCSSSVCWSTTYYIDATSGNDSNYGTATNNAWKTISKVNSSSFSAGDSILFKRGETWREQLTVPSSGSAANVITFGAYGSGAAPFISGADIVTRWVADSVVANVYNAIVAAQPNQVFKDETRIVLGTLKTALNDHEWLASGTTLSMRDDTGNPGSQSYAINASVRDYNVSENGKNNIIIQNVKLTMANSIGIFFGETANNVLINANTISYPYLHGISGVTGAEAKNITIRGNTINWTGGSGIRVRPSSHDWTIENNTIHNFSQLEYALPVELKWSSGIHAWCEDNTIKNIIVQKNTIYNGARLDNGTYLSNYTGTRGVGVWFDSVKGATSNIVIRYNNIHNNNYAGVHMEFTDYAQVYCNLVYGTNAGDGIRVGAYANVSNFGVHNNVVYNNVSYNNTYTCYYSVGRTDGATGSSTGNIFRNNIGYGCGRNLKAEYGGENDGRMGSGNIYLNNSFGPQSNNFIEWGHGVYKSTYSAWESAYGTITHSVQTDPLFVNPAGGDFHLQSSSPAIDAGTNVLLTTDYDGNPVHSGSAPDIGAFEYQVIPLTKPSPPNNLIIK